MQTKCMQRGGGDGIVVTGTKGSLVSIGGYGGCGALSGVAWLLLDTGRLEQFSFDQ